LRTMARKGRLATNKSQREVGDEVFRSKDTILGWEKGKTDIPPSSISDLARACGLSDEIRDYMKAVAKARRVGTSVEADMRFNALFLALAEEHAGYIFKFNALIIPAPLQDRDYHFGPVRKIQLDATDEAVEEGWAFKDERAIALQSRIANRVGRPTAHFLIGEAALLLLRNCSEELYQQQMARLRWWAKRPGISIRILRDAVPARMSSFDIYKEGGNPLACPPIVYTEIADSSWLIDDIDRLASYDDIRKMLWKMASDRGLPR
jgi:transcriptional regulator with XRE-family HTH domain